MLQASAQAVFRGACTHASDNAVRGQLTASAHGHWRRCPCRHAPPVCVLEQVLSDMIFSDSGARTWCRASVHVVLAHGVVLV